MDPWEQTSVNFVFEIYIFSFRKMYLKMRSVKCRPFCLGSMHSTFVVTVLYMIFCFPALCYNATVLLNMKHHITVVKSQLGIFNENYYTHLLLSIASKFGEHTCFSFLFLLNGGLLFPAAIHIVTAENGEKSKHIIPPTISSIFIYMGCKLGHHCACRCPSTLRF